MEASAGKRDESIGGFFVMDVNSHKIHSRSTRISYFF